ncbi:MAG: hypothetical protein KGJ41_07035 [Rhodospirillales bacterium]|nr:hypothetical protein [Rhodospirillales bacterium]
MYPRYNRILFGLIAAMLGGALAVSAWLQPMAGDLVRLGGYSENSFGWRGGQVAFSPPLARQGGRGDIVVLGDSFSLRTSPDRQTRYGGFWTDFLAAESGDTVAVHAFARVSLRRLLRELAPAPPRLVIVELAERTLLRRLGGKALPCPAAPAMRTVWPRHRRAVQPHPIARRWSLFASADQTADFLWKNLMRDALRHDHTEVWRLPLARDDLFTSRDAGTLLAYGHDTGKRAWSPADWAGIDCRLRRMQALVEAGGRTRFLFMMAPDKSAAYAPYLADPTWRSHSAARLPGVRQVHLDRVLGAAIAAGVRDVYLPDDTHWGSAGARLAARAVGKALEGPADLAAAEAGPAR